MLSRSLAAHADRLPRSGYRGSDFVQWHCSPIRCAATTCMQLGVELPSPDRHLGVESDPYPSSGVDFVVMHKHSFQFSDVLS
jgi:hypothetical protein